MNKAFVSILSFFIQTSAYGFEVESETLFPSLLSVADSEYALQLDILSTADIDQFEPIIRDFQQRNHAIAVRYVTAGSTDVMTAISKDQAIFDVVISSAMDLQTKLANDGFALSYESTQTTEAPDFARWRSEVFTFTEEPAAMVISDAAFADLDIPTTRQKLITLLRSQPDRFRNKIGTYDVRESGLGYLFASQDSRNSETYWRLTELMGSLDVRTYCCSSEMIDDVASGEIAIAYNVLGSYAMSRAEQGASIQVVLPDDYTLLMQRSVLIPRNSTRPELAGSFIGHLLRLAWQSSDTQVYPFPRMSELKPEFRQSLLPIRLGPGLLVFLDKLKRRRFIEEWEDSILQ